MEGLSSGLCVQVYVGETDQSGHTPRYQAMLQYLRREGAAGATVVRGIAGFGANSQIHTTAILTRASSSSPDLVSSRSTRCRSPPTAAARWSNSASTSTSGTR